MKYTCPISETHVDENVVRISAFIVLLLILLSFSLGNIEKMILFAFLTLDYSLKWRRRISYSPVARIAKFIAHSLLRKKPKPIDFEPKRFAAMLASLLSATIFLLLVRNLPLAVNIVSALFALFLFSEYLFGICVGCIIYSLLPHRGVVEKKSIPDKN